MNSQPDHPDTEATEYIPLPSGQCDSPEWQAARELDALSQDAQGRLALGCCLFWLSNGGYLLTALPPMGDVHGSTSEMTIYTAEHLVTIRGKNLHLLAWAMKQQRVDVVEVTTVNNEAEAAEWTVTAISAQARDGAF